MVEIGCSSTYQGPNDPLLRKEYFVLKDNGDDSVENRNSNKNILLSCTENVRI